MAQTTLFKKYLTQIIYGATDGTVTTFAVIGGVYGAQLSPVIVLILGFSNVFADGFSMAASNYLAQKSEDETVSQVGKRFWPIKSAIATFLAFILVGTIPLIPFVVALFIEISAANQFMLSIIATAFAFIASGIFRGYISGKNIFMAAFETLLVGGSAAAIAYMVGVMLKGLA